MTASTLKFCIADLGVVVCALLGICCLGHVGFSTLIEICST